MERPAKIPPFYPRQDADKPYRIIPPHVQPRQRHLSRSAHISNMYSLSPTKSQLNPHPARKKKRKRKARQLVISVALTLACTPSLIWEIFLGAGDDKSFPLCRSSIADFESPFLCPDLPASNHGAGDETLHSLPSLPSPPPPFFLFSSSSSIIMRR